MFDLDYNNMNMFLKIVSYTCTVLSIIFTFFCVGRFFCLGICERIDEGLMDENGWGCSTLCLIATLMFWLGWYMQWEFLVVAPACVMLLGGGMLLLGMLFVLMVVICSTLGDIHERIHNKKHGG